MSPSTRHAAGLLGVRSSVKLVFLQAAGVRVPTLKAGQTEKILLRTDAILDHAAEQDEPRLMVVAS